MENKKLRDMKQYMKYVMTMVVLLAMTVGTWATGTVTINKQPSDGAGTVTSSISQGVCTLTVTPALGYKASLENITVELTVSGNLAQAPRRSPDIYAVEVTALTPNADPTGETQYSFSMPGDADATVTVAFQAVDYGIKVNGIAVTGANRTHILGDNNETVKFNGHNTLILNGAALTKIEVTDAMPGNELEIYLQGSNTINNADGVAVAYAGADNNLALTFNVGDAESKLVYTSTHASNPTTVAGAFSGCTVTYNNNLAATLENKVVTIAVPMQPIVVSDTEGSNTSTNDYDSNPGAVETEDNLNNVIINNILYTLRDDGTKDSPDGFSSSENQKGVILNSEVTEEQLNTALKKDPGSADYAANFKGVTFLLLSGTGHIDIEAWSDNGHKLCVKIGDEAPTEITLTETKTTYRVDYAITESAYVRIYLPASSSAAPAIMASRRIGPKSSVAGGLGGISIQSNSIEVPQAPAADYKQLTREDMASKISAITDVKNGYVFNDPSITDLEDDMFLSGASGAPRRSGTYALDPGLTFIDFSGTGITGMEVSRDKGAFNGVPDNTFIYMPAGNSVAAGTKNVVIGGVCNDMLLNGATTNPYAFKAAKTFTASVATLERAFDADVFATVCLPYSVSAADAATLGAFYTVTDVNNTSVTLSDAVSGGLSATMPYVLKPGADVSIFVAKVAAVSTGNPGASKLVGVYEQTPYTSGDWYCYAAQASNGASKVGEFVKMKSGAYVPPFRAYLVGTGGAPSLTINWGGDVTAISSPVSTVQQAQPREGWWTLNGIRLNTQPQQTGMYVKDGKIVVIK